MRSLLLLLLLCLLSLSTLSYTPEQMNQALSDFYINQQLMGLSVQITKQSTTIYRGNFGYRDYKRNFKINNSTCFRMASLSKNVAAVGLYQLIQQKKLSLDDSLTNVLGFPVINPYFPNKTITVEMLMTHQSSIVDCDKVYDLFLNNTIAAKNVGQLPNIKELFTEGAKYYDQCSFMNKTPGTYYTYSNLGYVLVGNIIQKITNTRFDTWMSQNYLKNISNPSYNPATLPDIDNLAVLYQGVNDKWIPTIDNYQGDIDDRNMIGYTPGDNAAVYGPHAHLRATTDQMLKHINNIRVNSAGSLAQIVKPRYQYHGTSFGQYADWHAYGLGLYTTSFYQNDVMIRVMQRVLKNKVTVGHTGSGYGLISGMYYTGAYAFAYVINGILRGYSYNANQTIYQLQRRDIHQFIEKFIDTNS